MATTQITPDNDAIVTEIFIAAPPERVFTALINREQALKWGRGPMFEVTEWDLDPRKGGKWSFLSQERNGSAKFTHHGEILRIEPPRLLEYTWFANWHEASPTVVRWDLQSVTGGTQLKVTHSGMAAMPEARKGYAGGWTGLVAQIKQFVESH